MMEKNTNASRNGNVTLCSFRTTKCDEMLNNERTTPRIVLKQSESVDAAIRVRNLYHSYYEFDFVLRDTNVLVPRGVIYALLGPSGCGKTTLLKCILGCIRPKYGTIHTFGYQPGHVGSRIPGSDAGFMPQETSLYLDLTIEQMLRYFGLLYHMDWYTIKKRVDQLVHILELPDKKSVINTLSGGQIRRVSIAGSLINKPPLVVLDEPTAGVDPMLRSRIWDYLRNLCAESKTTIVITTHYIEEARKAHLVGLMRKGRLLAEDSPETLMQRYEQSTLEDVFLKLCTSKMCDAGRIQQQSSVEEFVASEHHENSKESLFNLKLVRERWSTFNIRLWVTIILIVTVKNTYRFGKHPMALLFQYLLPISEMILLLICVGGDPFDIPVALVNEEMPRNLSDTFIASLDKYYLNIRNYSDLQTAIADTKRLKLWGVIHIPANFSDNLVHRFDFDREYDPNIVNGSTVKVYADITNKLLSLTIERSLEQSFQRFVKLALIDHDMNPGLAQLPIALGKEIYGDSKRLHRGYREYMASGFLATITFALSFALTSLIMVLERKDLMFERQRVCGVTTTQLIMAHFNTRIFFLASQVFSTLYVTTFVVNIDSKGTAMYAIICLSLIGFSGLAFGIIISAICHEIATITIFGAGMLFFILIVSGSYWPTEAMPHWIRWFAQMMPTTVPTEAMRAMLSRGLGIADYRVSLGIFVSSSWFLILLLIGTRIFSY